MHLSELRDKKILILGLGVEGKSTLQFLRRHLPDLEIGVADQKDGPDYLLRQKEYDLVIHSPGIPKRLVTRPSTTATNIFFAYVRGTTIGVTGSKGKSTTASLLHAILKAGEFPSHLVGNIGSPMLEELQKSNRPEDIFVCELSSYQLDDIQYSPHISLFLNFFPDHMDYHGGVEEYWNAKKRIVAFAGEKDYFVYNPWIPCLTDLTKNFPGRSIPFAERLPFPEEIIPLLGNHNRENVQAAVAVASLLGIAPKAMVEAVKNFRPLPHRLEKVGTFRGITFYDDAISTTPESTLKALETLSPVGILLLGGHDRGYDFLELAKTILDKQIPNLVLFPQSGARIRHALESIAKNSLPSILETDEMRKAVEFAYTYSPKGSICLLSTASPSYSLWKNFEEKGNLFQYWVKNLGKSI